jgi:3D (Asp-Asp-Asp) domain-containing protein
VDPNVIPYGTEVIINGHAYIAQDCGGAIQQNRIDIYFESHEQALQFGLQTAYVYVKN